MRFSTDGTKIAAGSHSCVKVFDVNTFKQLYVCRKVCVCVCETGTDRGDTLRQRDARVEEERCQTVGRRNKTDSHREDRRQKLLL